MAKSLPLPGNFRETPTPYVGPDTKKSCPLKKPLAYTGSVIQQTIPPEEQAQTVTGQLNGFSNIHLRAKKGKKIGLIRVIKALHQEGFFKDLHGGTPTEEEVFSAFGLAVNEPLDDFTAQLSNNRKDNLPSTRANVFNTLRDSYLEYEQDIDNKKKERE